MGMTIDEAISEMELEFNAFLEGTGNTDPNVLAQKCKTDKDLEKVVTANNMAIESMRKYQKIEQIVKDIPYGGEATVRRIQEVIDDQI